MTDILIKYFAPDETWEKCLAQKWMTFYKYVTEPVEPI